MKLHFLISFLTATLMLSSIVFADPSVTIYIGTAQQRDDGGIYVASLNLETGEISNLRLAAAANRPSFLWIDQATKTLFSVGRTKKGDATVVSWKMDSSTGRLVEINRQPADGVGPCYVTVGRFPRIPIQADSSATDTAPNVTERFVAIANYGSGSVNLFPVSPDGKIGAMTGMMQHAGTGPNARRQTGPHAHSVRFDPTGRRLLAADLGTDQVFVHDIDSDGRLSAGQPDSIRVMPGTGPRHFVFDT
ncbi:MAG: beta-propeller fold lactonase family protein, partial [Planctomycetota bacterium]